MTTTSIFLGIGQFLPREAASSYASSVFYATAALGIRILSVCQTTTHVLCDQKNMLLIFCSRLYSIELEFYSQIRQIWFLSHPLGELGETYTLHL